MLTEGEEKAQCYLTNCASWVLTCIVPGVVRNSAGLKCQTSSKLHTQLQEVFGVLVKQSGNVMR